MITPLFFGKKGGPLLGVGAVLLLALLAMGISSLPLFAPLNLSPLIPGLLLGLLVGNTLRNRIPSSWSPGLHFSARTLLRTGVVLYGFRITYQEILSVGTTGVIVSVIMVGSTFLLGTYAGIRWFKLDRDTALLTASGSSICGAAAVLATEPVLKAEPHKSAIAVSTVVLFGTLSMFLYPALYRSGLLALDPSTFGIYIGGTVHEVAHVVAAGSAVGPGAAESSIIVKMTRVMLLIPVLFALSHYVAKKAGRHEEDKEKRPFPWFAVGFMVAAGVNSLPLLPLWANSAIHTLDTLLLTMAMTALGMDTHREKLKQTGPAPLYQAGVMFLWLLVGGYFVSSFVTRLCLEGCSALHQTAL